LARSPETHAATMREERSSSNAARPLFEKWELELREDIALHASATMPQLAGPAV
jgi:hypothetical protein